MPVTRHSPGLVLTEHELKLPLDRTAPDGEQITVFAREVTLVGKPKAFTPLPRLDPPAQGRFDVARHALGHAFPYTRPFLSQLSCRHGDAKGQKPSWMRGENILPADSLRKDQRRETGGSTRIMEAQPRRRLLLFLYATRRLP